MGASKVSIAVAVLLLALGCGGGSSSKPNPLPPGNPAVPAFDHVIIVIGENHGFDAVVGNSGMPFYNDLISKYALAMEFFADAHPSLPNYFVLTTGDTVTTQDDFVGTISADNVISALVAAGKTWKCYAESLPIAGTAASDTGDYVKRHVPFAYFNDVVNDAAQASQVVPFTQFATDLSAGTLPSYAFIVPNQRHNAHDCPLGQSTCTEQDKAIAYDQWLASNIKPVLNDAAFQNTLLILTWDEAEQSDIDHGGGHVATLLVSPKVKAGFQSTTLYQHESLLRLSLRALGVGSFPGKAASAAEMGEFFQ